MKPCGNGWSLEGLAGLSSTTSWNALQQLPRVITNESITTALTAEGDKLRCSSCHKSHTGKCIKVKTSAVAQGAEKLAKTCPVCGGQAHKYKMKNGSEGISNRVKDCQGFKSATDSEKHKMVKKLKQSHPICGKCSSWAHRKELCTWKGLCSKCNQVHLHNMCTLKKYFSCLASEGSNNCYLSLQDIPVDG